MVFLVVIRKGDFGWITQTYTYTYVTTCNLRTVVRIGVKVEWFACIAFYE